MYMPIDVTPIKPTRRGSMEMTVDLICHMMQVVATEEKARKSLLRGDCPLPLPSRSSTDCTSEGDYISTLRTTKHHMKCSHRQPSTHKSKDKKKTNKDSNTTVRPILERQVRIQDVASILESPKKTATTVEKKHTVVNKLRRKSMLSPPIFKQNATRYVVGKKEKANQAKDRKARQTFIRKSICLYLDDAEAILEGDEESVVSCHKNLDSVSHSLFGRHEDLLKSNIVVAKLA